MGSGWIKLHPESVEIPENMTLTAAKPGLTSEMMNNQNNLGLAWEATNWNGASDDLAKIAKPMLIITGTDDIYYTCQMEALWPSPAKSQEPG